MMLATTAAGFFYKIIFFTVH